MGSSVISAVVGLIGGVLKSLLDQIFKMNQQAIDAANTHNDREVADRQSAREMKGVQFSRRVIVISMCLALFWAPVIWSFLYPEKTFNVPINGLTGGLWALIVGSKETVKYVAMSGMTFVASLIDLFALVVGFYFGSGGTRK